MIPDLRLDKSDTELAQEAVRLELQGMLADTVGENAPVDVIILFQCPDGKFGFCSTNYSGALKQVGMLEATKRAILESMGSPVVHATASVEGYG